LSRAGTSSASREKEEGWPAEGPEMERFLQIKEQMAISHKCLWKLKVEVGMY
jgi:hypothetical protein